MLSVVFVFFLVLGMASASEITNVSNTEDSNLLQEDEILSSQNLDVSSEDSISETNIVNSHDDNLKDYPDDGALKSNNDSISEDNVGKQQLSSSESQVIFSENKETVSANDNSEILSSSKVIPTIANTHYNKIAKFQVTLKDGNGKVLKNQKVTLKINGKSYAGTTNSNGIATISTTNLAVGTYTATVSYSGGSSKLQVKVLKSVTGSNLNKGYGYVDYYKATFYKDSGVLANTVVNVIIVGKTYHPKTDSKGVIKFPVGLNPGKYALTAVNPVSGEKFYNTVVVTKDSTTIASNYKTTYVHINKKFTYTVTLKSKHNVPISNQKVYFKFNGKQVTAVTNKNGKASMTIPALSKGTYSISYSFKGNNYYSASSGSGTVKVQSSTTRLLASDMKSSYKDGSYFKVKLTNSAGKALVGKIVNINVASKTYHVKTDSKGYASLEIGLNPKNYRVNYYYSSPGLPDYQASVKGISVSKQSVRLTAGDLYKKQGVVKNYQVTVKDVKGKPLKSLKVKFTIAGATYTRSTNANGVATLAIGLNMGNYKITSQVVNSNYYTSKVVSKNVVVDGVKFVASDVNMPSGSGVYSVKLVNVKNAPLKNTNVKIACNGKTQTVKTDSNGIAKLSVSNLPKGTYTVKYSSDSFSGSSKIYVGNKVTLNQVIAASKTVRDYINKNHKLPANVKIGSVTYSTDQYLYVASKAIVNLKKGSTADLVLGSVSKPTKPGAASNMGNLYDYLSVAKSVVNTVDSKGAMPNSVSSKVGTIGHDGLVYAFSRVVAYYGEHSKTMPAYVTISSLSSSPSGSYLSASANCQVNNAQIQALAAKLTSGKSSDWDKAQAIFNYVRDHVSYSFYYNTKYGAVGTLNAKTGNCVDHSHLCNALFRASGLSARYVHGTCKFSSGSVYGHVWSQVYVNGKWVVADASSTRNSLGNHVNWNSGSIHGYYTSLGF